MTLPRRSFLAASAAAGGLGLAGCNTPDREFSLRPAQLPHRARLENRLQERLAQKQMNYGARLHLVAYKESKEMEIWLEGDDGAFQLFDILPICTYSGTLGPKLAEGDGQTPEGYYTLFPEDLHPDSNYHLALDIGFPNFYDKSRDRTGSLIRIHGGCESIGCYAMTDPGIEVIYLLAEESFRQGAGTLSFAAYPFRFSEERMAEESENEWVGFWRNLAESDRYFHEHHRPPAAFVFAYRYFFL